MLLDNILDRIDRLTCLPQVVKNLLPEHLSRLEPDDLQAYAEGPLALIEEWIEPLARPKDEGGSPHFHQVCIALEEVDDLKLLAQKYQVKLADDVEPWDLWLEWVWKTRINGRFCLHAVTGYWAWAYVWNQRDLTENVLSIQSDCYNQLGWSSLTVRLLEERYELSPDVYRAPEGLSTVLGRSILADCQPSTQANVLSSLADALRFVDGRGDWEAAVLLESWLRLTPDDYHDHSSPQESLQASPRNEVGAPVSRAKVLDLGFPYSYANVLISLSRALQGINRQGARDALLLLESWLQFTPEDYRDHTTLRKSLQASPLQDVGDPVTQANMLTSLAEFLMFIDGRGGRHAAVLLESWLQLKQDDYDYQEMGWRAIQGSGIINVCESINWANWLDLDLLYSCANVLVSLAGVLRSINRQGSLDALVLLERWLQLRQSGFRDQITLSESLQDCPFKAVDSPNIWANLMYSLAESWRLNGRHGPKRAVLLLESWLGLTPDDYHDRTTLQEAINASPLKEVIITNTWANVLRSLAEALRQVDGRGPRDVVALLESWLQLTPADYRDQATLRAALKASPLQQVDDPVIWANVLQSLAEALLFVDAPLPSINSKAFASELSGRGPRDAALLLESWLRLTPDDYHDHATLREALKASPLKDVGNSITWAMMLDTLGKALGGIEGRGGREALLLLESWLNLTPDDYHSHGTLGGILQASLLHAVSDPNIWANVLYSVTEALRSVDGRGERDALLLLESWLRLTPDDYQDQTTLREALKASPLQEVNTNIWVYILYSLAKSLQFVAGRGPDDAALLLESWLNLTPDNYRDHATLREALEASRLELINTAHWPFVLLPLTQSLRWIHRRGAWDALLLLESWLRLTPDDYRDHGALQAALYASPLKEVGNPVTWANVLITLANTLRFVDGRGDRDAVVLLETWLRLLPGHYRDDQGKPTPQHLQTALQASPLNDVGFPVTWANVLITLANALRFVDGRGDRDAAVLVKSWFQLTPDDYCDQATMCIALESSILKIIDNPFQGIVLLSELLPLVEEGEARAAALLLESWLQLEPDDYRDQATLQETLQASPLKESVAQPDIWAQILSSLANALQFVDGRGARHATMLLESWLQLKPENYCDHGTLRKALQASPLQQVGPPMTWAYVLLSLADALRLVDGRGDRDAAVLWQAALVDEAGNDVPVWELRGRGRFVGILVDSQLMIAKSVLQLEEYNSDGAWRICDAMATWIDETRREKLPTPQARLDFLLRIRSLYSLFRNVGLAHIARATAAGDPVRAAGCAARMFEWLELIENRSLIENLRPGQRPAGIDEHPELHPEQWDPERWPFAEDSAWNQGRQRDWEASWDDPDPASPDAAGGLGHQGSHWQYARLQSLMSRPMALQRRSSGPPLSQSPPPSRPLGRAKDTEEDAVGSPVPVSSVEIHDAATIALREQLWQLPSDLATLLPSGCLWLRFLFDDAGRLWWWAVERDKSDIKILATGQSEPGAHQRLQLATEVFDLKVDALWELLRQRGAHGSGDRNKPKLIGGSQKQKVSELLQWAAAPESLEEQSPPVGWPQWRQTVQGVLNQLQGTCWGERWKVLFQLVCAAAGDPVAEATRIKGLPIDPAEAIAQLEFRQPLVDISQVILEMQLPSDRVSELSANWLEAATTAHVQALTQELDLSSLWDQLTPEAWRETDILYQAQDSLWPYPLGLLPFGPEEYPPGDLEQPPLTLGDRVASLSCTVSLGLRHFAADRAKRSNEQETSYQSRVLSAQWLKEADREQMFGLGALEACLRKVAKSRDALIYSLGDRPGASLEHVDAALLHDKFSFEAAVFGGHGNPNQLGVEMQDAVWSGLLGGEMAGQDLLFLVSCVVGRLDQTASEAMDVRGLYTRLAACRAVIAARWPICNVQAAAFTVEFMMGYLSALKEAKTRGEPAVADFVRARILNDVRRRLTRPTADSPPLVTRHLAHAFELYGLG